MADKTTDFIKSKFEQYYKIADLYIPERLSMREFGLFYFESETMHRPVGFKTKDELRYFLYKHIPAHVYYSAAYYEDPSLPMAQKKWLAADLIFDLDADHLPAAEKLSYEEQLDKVKKMFMYLVDEFIVRDFVSEKDLKTVFSGARGYHLHITGRKVIRLPPRARRELVDYIEGTDLKFDWALPLVPYGVRRYKQYSTPLYRRLLPSEGEGGWRGRLSRGIKRLVADWQHLDKESLLQKFSSVEGIGSEKAAGIYNDLFSGEVGKRGVDKILQENVIDVFSKELYLKSFIEIVKNELKVVWRGVTDEPVTSDVKRLIRLPTTLHGKTGFVASLIQSRSELERFQPLSDASPPFLTDKPVKVNVKKSVSIRLRDELFSLKEGITELPEFAALFFVCRKFAELV